MMYEIAFETRAILVHFIVRKNLEDVLIRHDLSNERGCLKEEQSRNYEYA